MTFGKYRKEKICWNSKIILQIIDGKNLIKKEYAGADFDEDESYILDDYEVISETVNYGFDVHKLTLKK